MLFLPDQFLGAHVRRQTGRDNIEVWLGECHVHAGISPADVRSQVAAHPDAELLVHPECGCASSAIWLAGEGDLPAGRTQILSTGGMVDAARTMTASTALVATEIGMLHQLRKVNAAHELPADEPEGLVPVHEDDDPGTAAALRCARAATRSTSRPTLRPRPAARSRR